MDIQKTETLLSNIGEEGTITITPSSPFIKTLPDKKYLQEDHTMSSVIRSL